MLQQTKSHNDELSHIFSTNSACKNIQKGKKTPEYWQKNTERLHKIA